MCHSHLSRIVNNQKKPSEKIAKALRKAGIHGNINIGYRSGAQSGDQGHAQRNVQNGHHPSSQNNRNNPKSESKCARSSVDRASVFETGGRGFESLQAHHFLKLKKPLSVL